MGAALKKTLIRFFAFCNNLPVNGDRVLSGRCPDEDLVVKSAPASRDPFPG